jgi:glycosyltransferase involved in cell wall biosynthesis
VHDLGRDDIGCLIVGDGPEREPLAARAKQLRLDPYVRFAGFRSGEDLLRHLCSFDIGVIPDPPNVCNDKLSMNKVFELMALGIPFVQFNLMQCRREAGEAGLVVEEPTAAAMGKGIVALLGDEAGRARMSAYGRERAAREFQWDNEKKNLLAAYDALFELAPSRVSGIPGMEVTPR